MKNKQQQINKALTKIPKYEISPFYVSAFFDNHGSLCITQRLTVQIQFSQCAKSALLVFQTIFGGTMHTTTCKNEHQTYQYNLRICGNNCEKILKYLKLGVIMKWQQVDTAIQFITLNNIYNLNEKKVTLRDKMRKINKLYKKNHEKPYDRLNWGYIAGMFDAKGYIHLSAIKRKNGQMRYEFGYIKISQPNNVLLLDSIRTFIGHGKTKDKLSWKTERIDFAEWDLNQIVKLLIVKKDQVKMCLNFFKCNNLERKKELFDSIKNT